jgi:site-specific DNA-methyltransferase (adenine-specific)
MLYNCNCIDGSKRYIPDESIDLGIHDPPFGIEETKFDNIYGRDSTNVIKGYVEAPKDYYIFVKEWFSEAARILSPTGSMYIISGWTNSDLIGRVIRESNLYLINKLIWNYPFGLYTKRKYVTSHYEIFYITKHKEHRTFNLNCRYDKPYKDMESVWKINREAHGSKEEKNPNKLPELLIKKMIEYSSNIGDSVCDFFLGNFTTAIVAKKMGRVPLGFEMNPIAFKKGAGILKTVVAGSGLVNYVPTTKTDKVDDIFE